MLHLMVAFQIVFLIVFPVMALALAQRVAFIQLLGPVVLAYGGGIILAQLPLNLSASVFQTATEISVPLAIPLLLLSSDVLPWLKRASKALISFGLAVGSVMLCAPLFCLLFQAQLSESWKLAGMLVGVYTGGTPNMASVGLALEVEQANYLLLSTADIVSGGLFLLLLLTCFKPLLGRFLPPFESPMGTEAETVLLEEPPFVWREALQALGAAIGIVALSAGLSWLLLQRISVPLVMLALTSLSLGASLVPRLQRLKSSYALGNYFILIFCIAIGGMVQWEKVVQASGTVLLLCFLVMGSSIVLHILLARLFQIDVDTVIITATAAIYGPAFIGPVAQAIHNREVVVAGLTTGVLGYALGNYLGLMVAYGMQALVG